MYTLDPDGVQNMINNALTNRKEKLERSRDLVVEMRPEFADALNKCLNFSSKSYSSS